MSAILTNINLVKNYILSLQRSVDNSSRGLKIKSYPLE